MRVAQACAPLLVRPMSGDGRPLSIVLDGALRKVSAPLQTRKDVGCPFGISRKCSLLKNVIGKIHTIVQGSRMRGASHRIKKF